MIIYKKNRIVGWINIILGILGCISWFICSSCMKIEEKAYIRFTSEQDLFTMIGMLLIVIPLTLTFIVNLIYIFRNWHNKKSMILNILAIVSVILSVLLFILESYKYGYIISILAILGILLLIFNKDEEEGKKHKTLFGIMIINIILFIISSIVFMCVKSDFKISYANNEKKLIKNIIQASSGLETNIPIMAKKNGKWGYINSYGNTIIDFNYDDCSNFIEIENIATNKKYYIAVVSIGNEVKIITNDNKQIASYQNTKRERTINCSYILYNLEENLEEEAETLNIKIKINDFEYDSDLYVSSEKEIKYNSNLGYYSEGILSFDIPDNEGGGIELNYNTRTESVTYNRKKVSIDGFLYFYKDGEDYECLDTYKNGYVPIYNFEKEIFGWIDLKGQTHYINGKKQILDFSDKYVAIKDYSIDDDAKVYIMNYDGEIMSEYYKEITVLDKGFVVKQQNGKNVYLDDNLRKITQEYDIIDTCRVEDGILIVSNLNRDTQSLQDIRFDLININNGRVLGRSFEYINGMNDKKYEADYYYDIAYNEFKKILCSVDCDYLNTELYENTY
jgi:hypothetical protein